MALNHTLSLTKLVPTTVLLTVALAVLGLGSDHASLQLTVSLPVP